MRNVLPRFGAKATGSLNGRFRKARLWLTAVYVGLLAAILFLSGTISYCTFSQRLQYRFANFHHRPPIDAVVKGDVPSPEDVRTELLSSLALASGLLLVVAGTLSYWLAGITLRPIQTAYDRQRRFLGDASHELRTPITILKTDLENERDSATAEERTRIESHLEEVERMNGLVCDLFSLSRLDEEDESLGTHEEVAVRDVVATTIDRLQSIAKRQHVELIDQTASLDTHIRTNKEFLLKALGNIVKNAITYSKPDGGTVTISARTTDDAVHIDVTDTGIGIAQEDLERIFDRFFRADRSRSRATGGSGLGLSIVDSIMQRLGGSISVQSVLNEGSTFTLTIPIHTAS